MGVDDGLGSAGKRQPPCDDVSCLRRRIRVALGQEPGDLLIAGGRVLNVFNRRVEPADVVVADGHIAGVGCYEWRASRTIPASGRVVLPGLIDAHMHLESTLLTPAELARLIVPMGTTAMISDSHEVANVLGVRGIDMLVEASEGLPLDLFFMASSCVPATQWEDAGAVLGGSEVRDLLARPRVLGLAEVMDIPALLGAERGILEKVQAALMTRTVADGHAPALAGRELMAYASAGIRSDHESTTVEEARAKAALGMLVQVREGSSARTSMRCSPSWPAARSTSRGASPPTTSFPTTCADMATSTGCSVAWWPAVSNRPSRSGMPPTCRPGTMVSPIAVRWPRAIEPT